MTATYLLGGGIHTRLGQGLKAHAAALRAPHPALLARPAPVQLPIPTESDSAPYHLVSDAPLADTESRFYRILDNVVQDALDSAQLTAAQRARTGVYLGTSSSDIGLIEARFHAALQHDPAAQPLDGLCSMDNLAPRLRRQFGLGPDGMSVNTACTASANALLYADTAIQCGQIDHALVIGVEIFNTTTALGFQSLELLTPTAMRPFDDRRDGLVLGEAVAATILSRTPGPAPHVRLLGGATLSDTHGISAANPDGSSIAAVMRKALTRADLAPSDIAAIKAHGTASLLNDEGESAAMRQVFGDAPPPICALKPYIGHTFGASGLCELLMVNACMAQGFLPGVSGVAAMSSALGVTLLQEAHPMKSGVMMFNQFGFGGNNTSLVVAHD